MILFYYKLPKIARITMLTIMIAKKPRTNLMEVLFNQSIGLILAYF